MIKNPYELEYSFACSFFVEKNDTVRGIIGNTHGVNRAKNPPNKPNIKMLILLVKLFDISLSYSFTKSSEFFKSKFKELETVE